MPNFLITAVAILQAANALLPCQKQTLQLKPRNPDAVIPDKCCGDLPYNSGEKGCCTDENNIFYQTFDRTRHGCCNGNTFSILNGLQCCGRQTYNALNQACCQDFEVYNPDAYECCPDGSVASKGDCTAAVCGDQVYDLDSQGCCAGNLTYSLDDMECCNEVKVTTLGECGNFDICNGIEYNMATHSCCGDKTVYNHENMECCNVQSGLAKMIDTCPDRALGQNGRSDLFADNVFEFPDDLAANPFGCAWTKWSDWSECSGGFASGYQVRKRDFMTISGDTGSCPKQDADGNIAGQVVDEYFWHDTYEQRRTFDPATKTSCVLNGVMSLEENFLVGDGPVKRDLVIMTDESTSITSDNFGLIKDVIANLALVMCGGIGPEDNRIAVVRFSSEVKEDVTFRVGSNRKHLMRGIKKLKYKPIKNLQFYGSTYTAKALNYITKNVLKESKGWRANKNGVKTEVLIITDGRSNDPLNTFALNAEKQRLLAKGVDVYALGIGNVYEDEIDQLTSQNQNHVFYFPTWSDFGTFGSILERVKQKRGASGGRSTFDADGQEICLPIELSSRDKQDFGIAKRRKRRSLSSPERVAREVEQALKMTVEELHDFLHGLISS